MDLILHSFGTSLSKDYVGFVVLTKTGEKQRFSPDGIETIQIGRGVQITSDAILLALEKGIDILVVESTGTPVGRFWSSKFGSVSTIRKGQLIFANSPHSVKWMKETIATKIQNQQDVLLRLNSECAILHQEMDDLIHRLEKIKIKLKQLQGNQLRDVAGELRGYEGHASKIYFNALNLFLPEAYKFEGRSQHPALDITNAMLNYAYGILYGKVERALIVAGIDPYIGIFHRDEYNRPVFVYDFIEPYRKWADEVVISLLFQHIITEEFYSIQADESILLETLGRRVLIQSMNDYLEEVIEYGHLRRSRETQIQLAAHELAHTFKKFGATSEINNYSNIP